MKKLGYGLGVMLLILMCFMVATVFSESNLTYLTDYELQVEKSEKLVIVDFWAVWCRNCKIQTPVLERLAVFNQRYNRDKISWLFLDVDKSGKMRRKFKALRGLPALLFMQDGEEIYRIIGFAPYTMIQEAINDIFRKQEMERREAVKDDDDSECSGGTCPVPDEYK